MTAPASSATDAIRNAIRDVPDFPQPGILFRDITPVLARPEVFRQVIELFSERCRALRATKLVAIDARGFIFAAPVAYQLDLGLVPARKKGKLPCATVTTSYDLEYGSATLELHRDAIEKGDRVVIIDDLLATGGTAGAAARLVAECGGEVVEMIFLIELAALGGREKLGGCPVFAAVTY
jgi:adenine phosphoribosyltransferase